MNTKNEKGVISLFVVFAMLILLVFVISVYYFVKAKANSQINKNFEYQEIYSKNYEEISNIEYATDNEIIPIYNIDEFNVVGSNNYLQIKKKIYQCGREKSYILKDDIIVDIREKIMNKSVGFNDYKLYAPAYLIDKDEYDLYYYGFDKYWKVILYKNYSDGDLSINNETYTNKEFSILKKFSFIPNKNYDFLLIWADENGELKNEVEYTQKIQSNSLSSIYDLDIFKQNQKYFPNKGEFYIFIYVGDTI